MNQVYFGQLKDSQDIAFHFGFEGCQGYQAFSNLLVNQEILYANKSEDAGLFVMVSRDKDTGVYHALVSRRSLPDRADFKLRPVVPQQLKLFAVVDGAPEGYREFIAREFPEVSEVLGSSFRINPASILEWFNVRFGEPAF